MAWLYEDNSFIGVQLEKNLKHKEDIILEWTFLSYKQSKKLKTYVVKVSELILNGKLRL